MKTIQAKSNTAANAFQQSGPFFQRKGAEGFFSGRSTEPAFFSSNASSSIQAKLTVGRPDDKYEKEADSMADKVVQRLAMPDVQKSETPTVQAKPLAASITPLIQTKCAGCEQEEKMQKKEEMEESPMELQRKPIFESQSPPPQDDDESVQRKCAGCEQEEKLQAKSNDFPFAQRKCAECQQEEKLQLKRSPNGPTTPYPVTVIHRKCEACEHDDSLQRKESVVSEMSASTSLENRLRNSKGGGSPLGSSVNESMSNAFGSDFSGVRVHTDSTAVQMSRELNAQAFTHGNDIYFNSGKFNTSSPSGNQLLAHELTHTIQQGASGPSNGHAASHESGGNNMISKAGENKVMRAYLRDSTMEICHRVLKSQVFQSTNGVVSVKVRPRLSDPENPECEHHPFHISLTYSVGPFRIETDPINFHSSRAEWKGWLFVPDGECYLTIWREYDNPNCCLLGDIVVTDTAIVDCEEKRHNREFPSQWGGFWDWNGTGNDGTYGPGPRLGGGYPDPVYLRDPSIPSDAKCRGACGPNCDTCVPVPEFTYTNPLTGETWVYTNFEICNAHEGCRQHDAAFDWAAAEKGERGRLAPAMKWHMNANYECICNYNFSTCKGWIDGNPPHTEKLYFADSVVKLEGAQAEQDCKEHNPDFTNCTDEGADRDEVLVLWGIDNGYENFRDCSPHRHFPGGIIQACDLGPGKTWHCTATDVETGEDVTISIFECYCCHDEGGSSSDWRSPHLSVRINVDVASSRGAPILSQDAFNRAHASIRQRNYPAALDVVVADLVSSGRMNPSLYNISYVNRSDQGEGLTTTNYRLDPATGNYEPTGPSTVKMYTPAFKDVQWLVSSVMHEYQHVQQMQGSKTADELDDLTGEHSEVREVEAYLWEIEHSDETGMAAQPWNMKDTMKRLTEHYDDLGGINPARQAQYTDRYQAAREYVNDLQKAPPGLPKFPHVFHHGSDFETIEKLATVDITGTGGVDFGRGFYTHTKYNWNLAREWSIRHSLGKRGWGVVTFPIPDQPWNEEIQQQLVFRNYRSQPRNIPINPDTGKKFKDWKDFVDYNKRKGRKGALPDWSEFDVIEGPLWGRLSKTNVHQVMFTSSGVPVLNRKDVKPLRKKFNWLFLRYR